MRFSLDSSEYHKEVVTNQITELGKIWSIGLPASTRFLMNGFDNAMFRMKLNSDKTYKMMMELVEKNEKLMKTMPEGADLVDFFGEWLEKIKAIQAYDSWPFVKDFVHCLLEHGLCDINTGILFKSFSISYGYKTEGMRDLIEKVLAGLE